MRTITIGALVAACGPYAFSQQKNWLAAPATAGAGGNWTDAAIWEKIGDNPERFADDDYPGHVITEATQTDMLWVDLRPGPDNAIIVDQEITFTGRLDAPEGAAGSTYLRITPTGSLTVNNPWDHPFRFGLGGSNNTLLEIDGGTLAGPTGITWLGSWGGTAEMNLLNGGSTDLNESIFGGFNGTAVVNIDGGILNTNRLSLGDGGTGTINLNSGELNVRGPIDGQPATFLIGGGGVINITDGTVWGSATSLADGLTGDNIGNWVQNGRIVSSSSTITRDWAYTGWNANIRWDDSGDGVMAWAIPEGGNLEGPQDQFVPAGATASFTATVTFPPDSGVASYQWQKDGEDLPGQTGLTLTLEGVTSASAGTYSIVVTETSGDVVSTASASALLVVVDDDAPVLLSVDMNVAGAAMSGNGSLRTTGVEPFVYPGTDPNPMQIGEGETFWNSLTAGGGSRSYTGLRSSEDVLLAGVTFSVSGALAAGDAPEGGFIDTPIEDWSGPLLRDFVYATGDDVMTFTLGGLSEFAGREVTLIVYALGPQSTLDSSQTRDDIATVSLASVNNPLNLAPVVTDTAQEGRDLRYNEQAFAAFEGVVAFNGTVNWTVGPVPGTPGWNALNGFQILITNQGEAPESTPIEEWRLTHFGATDNTGDGADGADFTGDGVKNLIKYAVGADPTVAGDAASHLKVGMTALSLIPPFEDDFAYTQDFIVGGVGATGWDRITGGAATGARIEAQNGVLHMTSTGTFGGLNADGTGTANPLTIARSVPKGVDLQATVQLVSAPSDSDIFDRPFVAYTSPQLYIGRSDSDGVSHSVGANFFDAFGLGNGMQVVENYIRTHDGSWAPYPPYGWMRIEFNHETGEVTALRSQDGIVWEAYGSQTVPALIASDAELEIGLIHVTWTENPAEETYVEWANFEIRDLMDDGAGKAELPFLSVDFDYVGDPSLTYIIEGSNNLSEGWSTLRTFGPFLNPGNRLFINEEAIGVSPQGFIRLKVEASE